MKHNACSFFCATMKLLYSVEFFVLNTGVDCNQSSNVIKIHYSTLISMPRTQLSIVRYLQSFNVGMTKGTRYREHLFYVLICCQSFLCHFNNSVLSFYVCSHICCARNCVNIIWHNIIKNKPKSPRHICASDEKQITTHCL